MPDPGIWMCPLHQEHEDQHPKPKVIVRSHSINLTELATLEFRRRKLRLADWTSKVPASSGPRYLHRVTIDQSDKGGVRDQEIALVQVAYDVTSGMD